MSLNFPKETKILECVPEKILHQFKGEYKQKHLLCDILRNIYKQFLATVIYKLSFATFWGFRIFWITWAKIKERGNCKCVVHVNIEKNVYRETITTDLW